MKVIVWVILCLVLAGSILVAWLSGGWARVVAVATLMIVVATMYDYMSRNKQ